MRTENVPKTRVITFGKPRNQTTRFMAGKVQFSFPFSVIDQEMMGQPEEESVTRRHCVVVTISDVRVVTWPFSTADMERVLFRLGSQHIAEMVKVNSLPNEGEIVMPMIGLSYPDKCQIDPRRVEAPNGAVIKVEVERPAIGFKA